MARHTASGVARMNVVNTRSGGAETPARSLVIVATSSARHRLACLEQRLEAREDERPAGRDLGDAGRGAGLRLVNERELLDAGAGGLDLEGDLGRRLAGDVRPGAGVGHDEPAGRVSLE